MFITRSLSKLATKNNSVLWGWILLGLHSYNQALEYFVSRL